MRYGKAKIENALINPSVGSSSCGGVVNEKNTAHTIGERIHISCIFNYRLAPAYDIGIVNKSMEIHGYVKYSDIDKKEKQVKVVQPWNGVWM